MVCAEIAPGTFLCRPDLDRVVIYRQPLDEDETTRCEEARELCPVDAIARQGAD
jgi:ferredoxin